MRKIMKYVAPFMLAVVVMFITVFVDLTPNMFGIIAGTSMILYAWGVVNLIPLVKDI